MATAMSLIGLAVPPAMGKQQRDKNNSKEIVKVIVCRWYAVCQTKQSPKTSRKELLKWVSEFSQDTTVIQRNQFTHQEIFENYFLQSPIYIEIKNIKFLGINLHSIAKDLQEHCSTLLGGWVDDSVRIALALQGQGPEPKAQNPQHRERCGSVHIESQQWGGENWLLGARKPGSLA